MQKGSVPTTVPQVNCGKYLLPQLLNVGRYYRRKRVSNAHRFATITKWDSFEHLLTRNLERMNKFEQPSRFMTTQELALVIVAPLLTQMGINATFVEHRPKSFPFIGSADLILCETAMVAGKPLLVGRNHSDLPLEFNIVDHLHGTASFDKPTPESELNYFGGTLTDVEREKSDVAHALQSLCHVMLVNDLAFGYFSSEAVTRFVNIVSRPQGLELRVSNPVNSHEVCAALAAISLEAYYGHPYLRFSRGFEALPEALEDPDIEPLSSFDEGLTGKIKWWVASRVTRQKYTITFDHRAPNDVDPRNLGAYTSDGSAVMRFGVVAIDNVKTLPTVLKICTSEAHVRREASMLQYLLERGSSRIPKLILYAHILGNDFHVLSLEPFGRQIVADDLLVPGVEDQMVSALDEMHTCGVMLVEITIGSFALEYTQSSYGSTPLIRIVGFSNAKLYKRIPEVARQKEQLLLGAAISEAKLHMPPPR